MSFPNDVETTLIEHWIEGDEIVLDNIPLTVQGGVGYQLSNAFPRKTQQGDPGPDDHPFNSTHTQRTWVNGCLVRDLDEAGDVGNYWDANAWTQTRGQLSAPLLVTKVPPAPNDPGGISVPHARLGDNLIWTKGNINGNIYEWQAADGQFHHPRDLSPLPFRGTITNTGAVFRVASQSVIGDVHTQLYLPSTAGYTRLTEDGLDAFDAPDSAEWPTIGFALNEDKLYRLTEDGVVFFTISHDDEWQFVGVVTDGSEARNIYQTYDEDGNRCIGVTTSSGLFLLDHDNAILMKTDFWFPEHAYNGFGAALWRAQDWISNGIGVQRRVGTLITQEGLDNRDGLPSPLAGGFITDLKPSYNWLVAAIAAQPPPRSGDEPYPEMFSLTQGVPYPIVSSGSVSKQTGAIYIHNGLGWAPFYELNRHPTRVTVTMLLDTDLGRRQQHLAFGDIDGGAYVSLIPATYYNPIQSPNLPVSRTWCLEESRIDWNLKDIPKIAKQINIKADHLYHISDEHDDPLTPPFFATPYYNRIQVICNWLDPTGVQHSSEDLDVLQGPGPYPFVELLPADPDDPVPQSLRGLRPVPYLELRATDRTGNSRRSAPIGWELYKETGRYLPTGLPHESIWMTYRGFNDERSDLSTAVIEWRSIVCRKWSRPNRVFTFDIDCSRAIKDLGTDEATHLLDQICLKVGGVPLVTGDEFYIVDVTRLDGSGEAGLSKESHRTITCLEFTDLQYERDIDAPLT